ncbi:MAG: hypothetical protein VX908_07770 [Planctomycetota bacterium]|nr:hypothetical protein [Planctomycetota bacterium]
MRLLIPFLLPVLSWAPAPLPTPEAASPLVHDAIKYSADGQGEATRRTLERLGIPTIPAAYHGGVDWNQDGTITETDRRQFRKWVDATLPAHATGPAMMDYEQPWWIELNAKELEPERLQEIMAVYIDGLVEAQAARPGLQWGYWGLPTMRNLSKGWKEQGLSIEPIIARSGTLFPSAYDCTPGENSNEFRLHTQRVLEAVRGRKPVIVYLNMRYCGQEGDRTKFMPLDELLANAHAVLDAEWTAPDGTVHQADGIALWDPYTWSDEEDWASLDRLHADAFAKLHALASRLRAGKETPSQEPVQSSPGSPSLPGTGGREGAP